MHEKKIRSGQVELSYNSKLSIFFSTNELLCNFLTYLAPYLHFAVEQNFENKKLYQITGNHNDKMQTQG